MKSNLFFGPPRTRLTISILWLLFLNLVSISCIQTVYAQAKEGAFILPPILSLLLNNDLPRPTSGDYVLLAANDLGMHCADQDHQIFSILPPFNVVHAQVVRKGNTPVLMDDQNISVEYLATSSPLDPVAPNSINKTNAISNLYFKSNFWDLIPGSTNPVSTQPGGKTIGGEVYDVLYPSVLAAELLQPPLNLLGECSNPNFSEPGFSTGCPSILNLFEPLPLDMGIPVPEGNELAAGHLLTTQQAMPGNLNTPQTFQRFDKTIGFFKDFDFGATLIKRNWWAADGIPISPIDDAGRVNPYPLMKIQAVDKTNQSLLADLDVVLPVAAEADCQNCHAYTFDCADSRLPASVLSTECNESGLQSMQSVNIMALDNAPGPTLEQQLYNAAKINILRLHDQKYGAIYTAADGSDRACNPTNDPNNHCLDSRRAIQCSQCHYSPALDLTQKGPVNEPQQGPNGRQQARHRSMSNVIHAFHGKQPDYLGEVLFPAMPAPIGRDPVVAENVLQKTCYSCHPGKNTDCLRGAMATGGVVCQDCHGDLAQVGNDFTIRTQTGHEADFILDGSLRVPWATEPGCQSCHTGDARTPNHPAGAIIAPDGIRLLQAYITEYLTVAGVDEPVKVSSMHKATSSRFAENQAINKNGDIVGVLYRLSNGHGGLSCESCHNSTHAIWPAQNVLSNDNVAASQLQGHQGTIIECDTCHTGDLGNTLEGPHGLHPVGGGRFANGGHEDIADEQPNLCRACHGNNGEGTVLSRAATNRSFVIEECENGSLCAGGEVENFQVNLNKGQTVSCTLCHENKL